MQGGSLMLLGMGIVFTFLMMLVFAMKVSSRLASYFDNGEDEQSAVVRSPVLARGDADVVPVIAAAVAVWRQRNR